MPCPTRQGHIKRDAPGYQDEFELQWRHYQACLQLLRLSPDQPSPELAELVTFVSQVAGRYPKLSSGFAPELISVLDEHHMLLEPSLRETMVKALILLRNRNEVRGGGEQEEGWVLGREQAAAHGGGSRHWHRRRPV